MWEVKESRGGYTKREWVGDVERTRGQEERGEGGREGETGCSAWMRAKMYFFSSFLYIFPSNEPW